MSKLLRANFYELFRSKFFYVIMFLCAFVGIFFTVGMYAFPNINTPTDIGVSIDSSNILSFVPSFASIVIPFASASATALFLDSQYRHGAIRNKLLSEHTRTEVYLANLITVCIPSVLYFLIYQAAVFGITVGIYDYDKFEMKATFVSLSVMLVMIIGISTVLSFVIGNLLRGGKMIVVILAVQYALNVSIVFGMYKHQYKAFEFITRLFPQSFLFDFSYSIIPEKIEQNFIISILMMTVLIVFGVLNFKKCDIK